MIDSYTEREAMLFRAGPYPDKDLEVTEDDLDGIVTNTAMPLNIKVEHEDSPFDGFLGFVQEIYRRGAELWGRLRIPADAWALIERSGARRLSVGIAETAGKLFLVEVSLVQYPRVADAAVLSYEAVPQLVATFAEGEIAEGIQEPPAAEPVIPNDEETHDMAESEIKTFSEAELEAAKAEARAAAIAEYEAAREAEAEAQAARDRALARAQELAAEGHISPEQVERAAALLFAVNDEFEGFLAARPVPTVEETAEDPPAEGGDSGASLKWSDDAARLLAGLGLNPAEV